MDEKVYVLAVFQNGQWPEWSVAPTIRTPKALSELVPQQNQAQLTVGLIMISLHDIDY